MDTSRHSSQWLGYCHISKSLVGGADIRSEFILAGRIRGKEGQQQLQGNGFGLKCFIRVFTLEIQSTGIQLLGRGTTLSNSPVYIQYSIERETKFTPGYLSKIRRPSCKCVFTKTASVIWRWIFFINTDKKCYFFPVGCCCSVATQPLQCRPALSKQYIIVSPTGNTAGMLTSHCFPPPPCPSLFFPAETQSDNHSCPFPKG